MQGHLQIARKISILKLVVALELGPDNKRIQHASGTGDNKRLEGAGSGRNGVRAERRSPFRKAVVSASANQHLNLTGTG